VTSLPDIQVLLCILLATSTLTEMFKRGNIPIADPGVGDLVTRLVLCSPQIEEQLAIGDIADVVVGDRDTGCVAVGSTDDRVLDARGVGERGFEVEIDRGGRARGGENEV
jgi:hypothetical protein